MEASVRLLNRHHSLFLKLYHRPLSLPTKTLTHISPSHRISSSSPPLTFSNSPFKPQQTPFNFPQPGRATGSPGHPFARIGSGSQDRWHFSCSGRGPGLPGQDGPDVTVVVLGWLGSQQRHLRRYVELYNARGINAVTFVASVRDVLSFDLGKKLEERIAALADELAFWLQDGTDRCLLFHTFSNTGWLAYGAILENLKSRQDLLEKIKGCVVDSGGDPDINPKVWAAGFTAALLKKRSSSAYPSVEAGEGIEAVNGLAAGNVQGKEPMLVETLLLAAFEKLFSFLLNLPDVNEPLRKIISTLVKNQPSCPQLYLYSSADKVIPFQSVESFIEEQRKSGRKVHSFNFGSSPHVDHYRTFPDTYVTVLQKFLEDCIYQTKHKE